MEIKGKKAYLTIREQQASRLSSPIDIETLDLHAEREAADADIDRLNEMAGRDPGELTREERALLPAQLAEAEARSTIMRTIAKELGQRAASTDLAQEAAKYLEGF